MYRSYYTRNYACYTDNYACSSALPRVHHADAVAEGATLTKETKLKRKSFLEGKDSLYMLCTL
jgi:hypothetical protein